MVSMLHVESLYRNLDGIYSRTYNKGLSLFELLFNLYGVSNPFHLNWADGIESYSLV